MKLPLWTPRGSPLRGLGSRSISFNVPPAQLREQYGSGPWRAPAQWSYAAGSQSSVVPTSRIGLPSILAPTWDDPHAREASKRPTVLIRIPPPTLQVRGRFWPAGADLGESDSMRRAINVRIHTEGEAPRDEVPALLARCLASAPDGELSLTTKAATRSPPGTAPMRNAKGGHSVSLGRHARGRYWALTRFELHGLAGPKNDRSPREIARSRPRCRRIWLRITERHLSSFR